MNQFQFREVAPMRVHSPKGLNVEGGDAPYGDYDLAQEIAPYAALRSLVRGKRVLDVGCRSASSARLLSGWGAAEVVAICSTVPGGRESWGNMGTGSVTLLEGDGEHLNEVLGGASPFDIVVCSRVLERVARPDLLLRGLATYLAPNGIALISCTNGEAWRVRDLNCSSPVRQYCFDEFRSLTTSVLGEARQWLLGAPVHGEVNYSVGESLPEAPTDPCAIVSGTLLLASRCEGVPSASACSRFVGIWGASVDSAAAVAAISAPELLEPWSSMASLKRRSAQLEKARWDFFEPELVRLTEAVTAANLLRTECLEPEIARLRHAQAEAEHVRTSRLEPEIARLTASLAEADYERASQLEPEIARLKEALAEAERTRATHFEPEISRLTKRADTLDQQNAMLRLQVADMQRRVLYYADQATSLESQVEPMRTRLHQVEPQMELLTQRVQYYADQAASLASEVEPMRTRLHQVEPQMELLTQRVHYYADQAASLASEVDPLRTRLHELEPRMELLTRIEAARGYRIWRKYTALYESPIIGPVLYRMRRKVGALLRWLSRPFR